jgi:hypothetical protein
MGVQLNPLRLMVQARTTGVSFEKVLTIGRLNVFIPNPELERFLVRAGLKPKGSPPLYPPADQKRYADGLFRLLGARTVDTLDFSAYEGATLLHNMNRPLPPELEEQYDVVFEGGTIEHVFNFPVALQNCLRAVKMGGRLFMCQMANNFCGHGFYNFSPELFYRVFAPQYGYRVEQMLVYECSQPHRIFQVADPAALHERVQIKCTYGTVLLIQAQRVARGCDLLADPPQQSDYAAAWEKGEWAAAASSQRMMLSGMLQQVLRHTPWLQAPYQRLKQARDHRKLRRRAHFGDPNWFRPFHFDPLSSAD